MNVLGLIVCFQLIPLATPDSPEQLNEMEARDVARLESADAEMRDLPEDLEVVVGIEVFGAVLDDLESPKYRQRVLLSLGRAHVQLGNTEEATEFLERAVAVQAGDGSVTGIARRALAQLLADNGELQEALAILKSADGNAELPMGGIHVSGDVILRPGADANNRPRRGDIDNEFLNLLKQARLLQHANRIDESLEILKKLEAGWTAPTRIQLILPVAQESTVMAHMTGRYDEEMELYDQILEEIPALGDDAQLQSNRIYCAIEAQRNELAVEMAEEFIARFPDSDLTCAHLFSLGHDALQNNDSARATEYFERLAKHPRATDEYLNLANEHLQLSADKRPVVPPSSSRFFRIVITLNVVAAVVVFIGYLLKRRRGTSLTAPSSSHSDV